MTERDSYTAGSDDARRVVQGFLVQQARQRERLAKELAVQHRALEIQAERKGGGRRR